MPAKANRPKVPTYLTADEKAFASKVHIASFAQKDMTKLIDNPASGKKDLPIQTYSDTDGCDPAADPSGAKTKADLYGALALTTARTKPTYDTVTKKFIEGWTNGVAA